MLNELTPQEIAENLEFIEKAHLVKGLGAEYDEMCESVKQAAIILRRYANGELKPVVRCGECKRNEGNTGNVNFIYCRHLHAYVPKDFGCIQGERKDGAK